MPVFDLYSKRLRRMTVGDPDVFTYDVIPPEFRIQIMHIWSRITDADFGRPAWQHNSYTLDFFKVLNRILCTEYGKVQLVPNISDSETHLQCWAFLRACPADQALDVIELSFNLMMSDHAYAHYMTDTIDELNHRFREHGVGYQFVDGMIMRVDSQYAHSEIVVPALRLLNQAGFDGASQEFLAAHEHYRNGRNEDAITWAYKALESTLKTICDNRNWAYPDNATAVTLIEVVIDKHLAPDYLSSHMNGLRSAMTSGVPTLRNKGGGHGQGAKPRVVPDSMAAFALHLTASNIVFLVERHKELS